MIKLATILLAIFLEMVFFASTKYFLNLNTDTTTVIIITAVATIIIVIVICHYNFVEEYIVPLVSHIINIDKLSTKDDMEKTTSQIKELNSKIDNKILSPNHHKDHDSLKSGILKKLITIGVINDIRVDNLLHEKSCLGFASKEKMEDFTPVILAHFNCIKEYRHAIAYCVINNTSLISSDMHLFEYFIRHFICTKDNLNIHRIFSIRARDIKPDTGNIVDNNSLLFYLIANYIAGVRVYLHVDNDNNSKLLDLDYVAAHYIDDDYKFQSKIYLSPKDNKTTKLVETDTSQDESGKAAKHQDKNEKLIETDTPQDESGKAAKHQNKNEKLVEIDNEFYLQSIFEDDYKERVLLGKIDKFIEFSPKKYNEVKVLLKLYENDRKAIKDTFIKKINDIPAYLDAEQNRLNDAKRLEIVEIAEKFFDAIPTQ